MFCSVRYEKINNKIPKVFSKYFDYAKNYKKAKHFKIEIKKNFSKDYYNVRTEICIEKDKFENKNNINFYEDDVNVYIFKDYEIPLDSNEIYKFTNYITKDEQMDYFHFEFVNFKDYVRCSIVNSNGFKNLNFELGNAVLDDFAYVIKKIFITEVEDKKVLSFKKFYLHEDGNFHVLKKYTKNLDKDYFSYLVYELKSFYREIMSKNLLVYLQKLYDRIENIYHIIPAEEKNDINNTDLKDMFKCYTLSKFNPINVNIDYYTIRKLLIIDKTDGNYETINRYVFIYYPLVKYENLYEKEKLAHNVLKSKNPDIVDDKIIKEMIVETINSKIRSSNKTTILEPRFAYFNGLMALKFDINTFSKLQAEINYEKVIKNIISIITKNKKLEEFFENGKILEKKWLDFIKENETDIINIIFKNSTLSVDLLYIINKYKTLIEKVLEEIINQ